MTGINADRRMLPRDNIDELHNSKWRRATRHCQVVADVKVATEYETVGNVADAVETRYSNGAAQEDGTDCVDVSRASDDKACLARQTRFGIRTDFTHQQFSPSGGSRDSAAERVSQH